MIIKILFTNTSRVEDFLRTRQFLHIQLESIMMGFISLKKQVLQDNWLQLKILKESHIEMRTIKKNYFKHSNKQKELKNQIKSFFKDWKIQNVDEKNGVSEHIFLIQTFSLIRQEELKLKRNTMNQNFYFLMRMNIKLQKILCFERMS